ncbi:hypothetical protein D9611_009578 [Ephemerocybe angulata]|uniref:Uncharacterized protein n=1 Tax=Ephemerocybe angulata TaxID=980116 RepID=A0A8H5C6V0_9AGAR|nr:hypothetical protein D9611_009578 [Tulosesus angulatus]
MRVSLALIPIVAASVSYVNAHSDPSFVARDSEYIDELAAREDAYTEALARREIMADISTRELMQEFFKRDKKMRDRHRADIRRSKGHQSRCHDYEEHHAQSRVLEPWRAPRPGYRRQGERDRRSQHDTRRHRRLRHLLPSIQENGDTNVANLIAQATEKVRKKGVTTSMEWRTIEDDIEIVEGMHLDLR